MKVLVACEMSGIVREAFRAKGHDAWSCDIMPTEISSKYHIQDDVLKHLDENWDAMIAHPPCQLLCVGGRTSTINATRQSLRSEPKSNAALEFFMKLFNSNIPKICIENPTPLKKMNLPKETQAIQPYQFGHDYSKRTCLWLKNLPKLKPTKMVQITYIFSNSGKRYTAGWYRTPRNSVDRSRTFQGIADAMASQWGNLK